MTKKKNVGWSDIDGEAGGKFAEKTVAFGDGPLKTHRLYGASDEDVQAQIEAFEDRLKAANGDDDGE